MNALTQVVEEGVEHDLVAACASICRVHVWIARPLKVCGG